MFDIEYVDPDKSKCPECGCSFGVHLITCSRFVDPLLPSTTCVINLHDTRLLAAAQQWNRYLYIGRASRDNESIWGNPFSHKSNSLARFRTASLAESLTRFEDGFLSDPLFDRIEELRGKILGCFCAPLNRYLTSARPWVCHGQIYCHYLELLGD